MTLKITTALSKALCLLLWTGLCACSLIPAISLRNDAFTSMNTSQNEPQLGHIEGAATPAEYWCFAPSDLSFAECCSLGDPSCGQVTVCIDHDLCQDGCTMDMPINVDGYTTSFTCAMPTKSCTTGVTTLSQSGKLATSSILGCAAIAFVDISGKTTDEGSYHSIFSKTGLYDIPTDATITVTRPTRSIGRQSSDGDALVTTILASSEPEIPSQSSTASSESTTYSYLTTIQTVSPSSLVPSFPTVKVNSASMPAAPDGNTSTANPAPAPPSSSSSHHPINRSIIGGITAAAVILCAVVAYVGYTIREQLRKQPDLGQSATELHVFPSPQLKDQQSSEEPSRCNSVRVSAVDGSGSGSGSGNGNGGAGDGSMMRANSTSRGADDSIVRANSTDGSIDESTDFNFTEVEIHEATAVRYCQPRQIIISRSTVSQDLGSKAA